MSWSWSIRRKLIIGLVVFAAALIILVTGKTWINMLKILMLSSVFVLLLSAWLFDEIITLQNVVGSIIIILGIALFAKADKEVEA